MNSYSIVVPTCNGGRVWAESLLQIRKQDTSPKEVFVIDSSSTDDTVGLAKADGCKIATISQSEFNHGKTRQLAVNHLQDVAIVILLTQDAVLLGEKSVEAILDVFKDDSIGAVYGKQVPRVTATLFEKHERDFTYGNDSRFYGLEDRKKYGMKTCFLSNAFTAYRLEALKEIGGFPDNTIVSEDMYVGAKMLKAGWRLAYCAEAAVVHSHSYNLRELFGRYFDIGVFNTRESWIREEFGGAEREGLRYVKSELGFLLNKASWLIPYALIRTLVKFLGFKMGLLEKFLPNSLKKAISRQKNYWS